MTDTTAVAMLGGRGRRLDRMQLVVPYVALAGSMVLVLFGSTLGLAHKPLPVLLPLVAVTGLWLYWWVTRACSTNGSGWPARSTASSRKA